MQFGQYKKSFSSLQLENNFFRILTLGLLTLVLILVVALLNKKTIVTLQPWTLARDAQVTETQASNSYMEAWGLALAQLIGNVTPGNVDFVGEQISRFSPPRSITKRSTLFRQVRHSFARTALPCALNHCVSRMKRRLGWCSSMGIHSCVQERA